VEHLNKNPNLIPTNEIPFDSTYFFLLRDGYIHEDTMLLNSFFDLWNEKSLQMINSNEDKIVTTLNGIFIEIYHPFDFEKYGWSDWKKDTQYKYAILPSEIKYKITNTKLDVNDVFQMEMDTLKAFYTNPDIGNAKKLYDIDPFRKSMKLFLKNDYFEKLFFLDTCCFVNTPISSNWKVYKTPPEIIGVVINKKLNHATAYLRLNSVTIGIELSLENKKWKIKEIKELNEE
jgi:hypothetical protein